MQWTATRGDCKKVTGKHKTLKNECPFFKTNFQPTSKIRENCPVCDIVALKDILYYLDHLAQKHEERIGVVCHECKGTVMMSSITEHLYEHATNNLATNGMFKNFSGRHQM